MWYSSQERKPAVKDGLIIVHWPHVLAPGGSGEKQAAHGYDMAVVANREHLWHHNWPYLWTHVPQEPGPLRDEDYDRAAFLAEHERDLIKADVGKLCLIQDQSWNPLAHIEEHNNALRRLQTKSGLKKPTTVLGRAKPPIGT